VVETDNLLGGKLQQYGMVILASLLQYVGFQKEDGIENYVNVIILFPSIHSKAPAVELECVVCQQLLPVRRRDASERDELDGERQCPPAAPVSRVESRALLDQQKS
jgi:hypothetical protein